MYYPDIDEVFQTNTGLRVFPDMPSKRGNRQLDQLYLQLESGIIRRILCLYPALAMNLRDLNSLGLPLASETLNTIFPNSLFRGKQLVLGQ